MNFHKLQIVTMSFALVFLLAFMFAPAFAYAAEEEVTTSGEETCRVRASLSADETADLLNEPKGAVQAGDTLSLAGEEAGDNALLCTYGFVKFATNVVFIAVLSVAALFIALSAFHFITAGEKSDKKTKAKDYLVWSIVGLVVAALARVIPAIVRGIIGL